VHSLCPSSSWERTPGLVSYSLDLRGNW